MIQNIFIYLKLSDFKGESELIDIAKGKYKKPKTFKEVYKQFKRQIKWQSQRQS